MRKLIKNELLISILFFTTTVAIFGPLELYITNKADLWFNFKDVVTISLILSAISVLALGALGFCLKGKHKNLFCSVVFALTLCLYLQGNYLNISYGLLDGRTIDWSNYTKYAVFNTSLWIFIIGGLFYLRKKFPAVFHKIHVYGSLLIISMQIITLGVLMVSNDIFVPDTSIEHSLSADHITHVGDGDNIIVFVLDAFDDPLMDTIMDAESEKYESMFSDFVRFTDCAAGGATTTAGVPILITGEKYPGQISFSDYVDSSFNSTGLYSALKKHNYSVNFYTDEYFLEDSAQAFVDNYVEGEQEVNSISGLTKKYTSFVLYKYMPHILKQYFWLYTGDFDAYKSGASYISNDAALYNTLKESKLQLTQGNTMTFLHMDGAHAPYDMDEFAQPAEEVTRLQQAKGSLLIVSEYLEQMKALGVYDNSLIIITSDHGDTGTFSQSILFVKDRNAADGFTVNDAPVSHFDLHNTIFSYLGEEHGDTFFDIPEDEPRSRNFYLRLHDSGTFYMEEYLIEGKQSDVGMGTPTGVKYAPAKNSTPVTYNTPLTFGLDGTVNQYIISGMDPWPVDYVETFGEESLMQFDLGDYPKCDLIVDLNVHSVYDDIQGQHLTIYANDYVCYEGYVFTKSTISFQIPADALTNNLLTLKFAYGSIYNHINLSAITISRTDDLLVPQQESSFSLTHIIGIPLTWLLEKCHGAVNNYVLAIFLFTFLTKVILLPVSLWTNKNGIIMIKMMPELNRLKVKYYGDKETISDETQALYKREKYNPIASSVPMIIQVILLMGVIDAVKQMLGGVDSILNAIPTEAGGITWGMPVLAALAALALGIGQNLLNPLQKEQTKKDQWFTNGVSIAISLFLGAFVSVGTCVYWIASNLFTIPFQALMNVMMPPEKYVDYEALEESRKDLAVLESLKEEVSKEDKKREKADYKRFFSVANKHLVFYSERSGFYKYFQNIIAYLLENSNLIIHYVTNDPKDQIFEIAKSEPRIRPYYIGQQKIITLMMKMDADMVITTTHELDTYYLKRSYVRKDIEYIYVPHAMVSTNMTSNKGCVDHYDTVFCVGKHQLEELQEAEEMYGTKKKNLVPVGYGMLDNMLEAYAAMPEDTHERKRILVAPSWQEDNLLDSCVDRLVEQLYDPKHFVVVRPHPEYVKRFPGKVKALQDKFAALDPQLFLFETDFSSNVSIYTADMLITDWSGIVQEFCYTTKKPGLMINTPMKVMNPEYTRYKNPPLDITMRSVLGKTLDLHELDKTRATVEELFDSAEFYDRQITAMTNEYVYNIGSSGSVGGRYIIKQLMQRDMEREAEQK